ncbi:MAG: hypothetical protein AB7E60_05380 [Sphingobium sp.]
MLNDWSDRDPKPRPPGWRGGLVLLAATAIGVALVVNIVRGISTGVWNW